MGLSERPEPVPLGLMEERRDLGWGSGRGGPGLDLGSESVGLRSGNAPSPRSSLLSPVPARIVNISSPVAVNEGGNVNLLCLAVGRPEPTVTWRQLRGEDPLQL